MKRKQLKTNYFRGLFALLLFMGITLFVHCFIINNNNAAIKEGPVLHIKPVNNKTIYSTNRFMSQSIGIKTRKEYNQFVKIY